MNAFNQLVHDTFLAADSRAEHISDMAWKQNQANKDWDLRVIDEERYIVGMIQQDDYLAKECGDYLDLTEDPAKLIRLILANRSAEVMDILRIQAMKAIGEIAEKHVEAEHG
jgi:CBS-domain-containing membrane protein